MGLKYSNYLKSSQSSDKKQRTASSLSLKKSALYRPHIQLQDTQRIDVPEPLLTERQKELLVDSFEDLKTNLSQVGVLTFLRLFETHPEVQGFFGEMKDLSLDELPQSKILRQHGLRIMNFLEKCISRINMPEKMDALIEELGTHHVKYGAPIQYIQLIGPQFISAIKPQLQSKWDTETEQAWLTMFSYISYGMNRAMFAHLPKKSIHT